MTTRISHEGLVLQGYFQLERFRSAGTGAAAAQIRGAPSPAPPRPELLPAKMLGEAAQARAARGPSSMASRAPRPELLPASMRGGAVQARSAHGPGLASVGAPTGTARTVLPGMGPARVGPPRVGQARSSRAISTTPVLAGQLRVIGAGRPLEPAIRQTMETFFQADFSDVRVHEGATARSLGALAFTLGNELHFAPGLYDPASREGVALLGHELTHVIQQRDGRVTNPYGQGVAIVQDPALEAEADQMGQQIAEQLWSRRRAGQPAMAADRRAPRASDAVRMSGMRRPSILAKLDGQRAALDRGAPCSPLATRRPEDHVGVPVVQPAAAKLVETKVVKLKKKTKERKVNDKKERTLDGQIDAWVHDYGHSVDRHSGLTTAELDGRNLPLATTFDTEDDLLIGAKAVIAANAHALNTWYANDKGSERIVLWAHCPDTCTVRGRRRRARPAWHAHQQPMPPHPGYEDVPADELSYVVGIFDRSSWDNTPLGLVTCYPSGAKPT